MQTSTKRYENLNKEFLDKAYEMYPNMEWVGERPSKDIEDNYGKGILLTAKKGVFEQTYFILKDDPRREQWIKMIASQVQENIDGSR